MSTEFGVSRKWGSSIGRRKTWHTSSMRTRRKQPEAMTMHSSYLPRYLPTWVVSEEDIGYANRWVDGHLGDETQLHSPFTRDSVHSPQSTVHPTPRTIGPKSTKPALASLQKKGGLAKSAKHTKNSMFGCSAWPVRACACLCLPGVDWR